MVSTVGACELTRWTQPPDAENRMSGGVGGLTGAIPLVRPDLMWVAALHSGGRSICNLHSKEIHIPRNANF